MIIIVPLQIWTFGDIDQFQVFEPFIVCIVSEVLYNNFKIIFAVNMICIETFDKIHDIDNKIVLFFAVFDNSMLSCLNILFKYQNIKETWSEDNLQSGRMEWLLNSSDISLGNIKSITEYELSQLSTYLVGAWTIGLEMSS